MQKQRNTIRKRLVYLAVLCLIALTTTATSTFAWSLIEWNFLTGGSATAIIVILSVIAFAIIYAKFFRGSATKLFSKIKGFRK